MKQSKKTEGYTKGPWHVSGFSDIDDNYLHIGAHNCILGIASMNPNHTDTKANASRIVHCVNTYDELVGALEALVIFDEGALKSKRPDIFARHMNRARAALKLAKKRGGENEIRN